MYHLYYSSPFSSIDIYLLLVLCLTLLIPLLHLPLVHAPPHLTYPGSDHLPSCLVTCPILLIFRYTSTPCTLSHPTNPTSPTPGSDHLPSCLVTCPILLIFRYTSTPCTLSHPTNPTSPHHNYAGSDHLPSCLVTVHTVIIFVPSEVEFDAAFRRGYLADHLGVVVAQREYEQMLLGRSSSAGSGSGGGGRENQVAGTKGAGQQFTLKVSNRVRKAVLNPMDPVPAEGAIGGSDTVIGILR